MKLLSVVGSHVDVQLCLPQASDFTLMDHEFVPCGQIMIFIGLFNTHVTSFEHLG